MTQNTPASIMARWGAFAVATVSCAVYRATVMPDPPVTSTFAPTGPPYEAPAAIHDAQPHPGLWLAQAARYLCELLAAGPHAAQLRAAQQLGNAIFDSTASCLAVCRRRLGCCIGAALLCTLLVTKLLEAQSPSLMVAVPCTCCPEQLGCLLVRLDGVLELAVCSTLGEHSTGSCVLSIPRST